MRWFSIIPPLLLLGLLSGCGNICFSYGVRSCARPLPHWATPLFGVWLSEDPKDSQVTRIEIYVDEGNMWLYARVWETCDRLECPFRAAEASSASVEGGEPGVEVRVYSHRTDFDGDVHVLLWLLSNHRAQAEVTYLTAGSDGDESLGTNTYFFYRAQ